MEYYPLRFPSSACSLLPGGDGQILMHHSGVDSIQFVNRTPHDIRRKPPRTAEPLASP